MWPRARTFIVIVFFGIYIGFIISPLLPEDLEHAKGAVQAQAVDSRVSSAGEADNRNTDERTGGELAAVRAQNAVLVSQLRALQRQVDNIQLAQDLDFNTASMQEKVQQKASVSEQEAQLAMQTDQQHSFAVLEEEFYAESADPQWAATMQREWHRIEERLQQFTSGDTSIEYHECRSGTCRVEFVHATAAPALLPALIASPYNSQVVLQSVNDGGVEKTIALYKR